MLYNFLTNNLFPFGLSFFITGVIFLVLNQTKLFINNKKIVYIIAQTLYMLGIVCCISMIPIFLAKRVVSGIFTILILGICIFDISLLAYNENNSILFYIVLPTLLCFVFSIIFAITLYPQYSIVNTDEKEYKVQNSEIREVVIFNNIPLNANSYEINIVSIQEDNETQEDDDETQKDDEKKDDYINYWYITDNNDVIYDKVNAYDTTLVSSKDNKYYLEINKYVTLTKQASKVSNLSPKITERTVNVFHLPEEIVGISN